MSWSLLRLRSCSTIPCTLTPQALLSAIPQVDKAERRERILLEGEIPNPINPPEGCRFHTRCRLATEICLTKPEFRDVGNGHFVACHHVEEGTAELM
ncbi:MAG: oligopeptide/dipeptide ABC transporter ATP-binding protein [Bacillota bacterium]